MSKPKRKWDAGGMTDDEAIAAQKRLLAEARARMDGCAGGRGGAEGAGEGADPEGAGTHKVEA